MQSKNLPNIQKAQLVNLAEISLKTKLKNTAHPTELKRTSNSSRHHCAAITAIWTAAELDCCRNKLSEFSSAIQC